MKLIGLMPARNEEWVIRASVRAALTWCDSLIVLDHASTDSTCESVLRPRVSCFGWTDPVWRETSYRQRLLNLAIVDGATHVVTIDADEILTANAVDRIRDEIALLNDDEVLRVPWLQLWGSLDQYRNGDSSVWSTATAPIAFKLTGDTRYADTSYDIHTRVPAHLRPKLIWEDRKSGLMHLQHVSRRRLAAKQTLYMMTERLRWNTPAPQIKARYGPTLDETGIVLSRVPSDWWGSKEEITPDSEPWQEGEVKRLLAEHGREKFDGLDLHGF